jgi:hypothetical protein
MELMRPLRSALRSIVDPDGCAASPIKMDGVLPASDDARRRWQAGMD